MSYYNRGSIGSDTPVVKNLIIVNVIVFAAQLFLKNLDITNVGALYYFKRPEYRTFQYITSIFMHSDESLFHIFYNMSALWIFGNILEKIWGPKKFLFFYLVCGLGAGFIMQIVAPFYAVIGASGAIMGLMAAFAYLFPNTEMTMMYVPMSVRVKFLIPIMLCTDLFSGIYRFRGDNTAHFAHLGGALIGFLITLYWNKTNKKTFY